MAILDIFKKKKRAQKTEKKEANKIKKAGRTQAPKAEKEKKAAAKMKEAMPEVQEPAIKTSIVKKRTQGASYGILHSPHITEKATDLSEKNKYVFKVYDRANKSEIKKAVENNYGVSVTRVNIINVAGKKRRVRNKVIQKPGYKKAIVRIAEGQKIEILPR